MTYNLFFLLTGDPGREALDPNLLGEVVKIVQGSDLLHQIFNLIARYVRKCTHPQVPTLLCREKFPGCYWTK
jgi:hypothetical protein